MVKWNTMKSSQKYVGRGITGTTIMNLVTGKMLKLETRAKLHVGHLIHG